MVFTNVNVTSPLLNSRNANDVSYCNILTNTKLEDKRKPIFLDIRCTISNNISDLTTCYLRIDRIIDIYLYMQWYNWTRIIIFNIIDNQRRMSFDDLLVQDNIYSIHWFASVHVCKEFILSREYAAAGPFPTLMSIPGRTLSRANGIFRSCYMLLMHKLSK